MDSLRIFIIGTFTLLVGAAVYYFVEQDNRENEANRFREQISSYTRNPYLTGSTTAIPAPSSMNLSPPSTANTTTNAAFTDDEQAQIDLLKEQIAAKDQQIIDAEKEKERYLKEATVHKEEVMVFKEELQEQQAASTMASDDDAPSLVEEEAKSKKRRDRVKLIESALLMAKIIEYDPNSGIVGMRLIRPQHLRVGEKLSIRRQTEHGTGVMGWVELTNIINSEQAAGQVIPGSFHGGMIEVSIGDELIITP